MKDRASLDTIMEFFRAQPGPNDESVNEGEDFDLRCTVVIRKMGGGFEAQLTSAGGMALKDAAAFGVKERQTGRSGWEALQKMADNWKRSGFLD